MYIYRFVDENDRVIYVGKTKQSLRARFYSHNHLPDECYQKVKYILDLRYCDVFDEDDEVRGYRIVRDNITYDFPYPFPVVILLNLFKNEYGFNFSNDKEKYIFVGNKGEKLHYTSINKSILLACSEFDFNQRHSCESMRKTFFRYIFDNSENVYEAIECIEFMSGVYRNTPGRLLKYIDVIPHNEEFNPLSYMKGKYIINKIDFDWNITFKFENKWAW